MKIIDIHVHTEFDLERLLSLHDSYNDLNLTKEKFLEDVKDLELEYVFSIGKKDGLLRPFFDDSNPADLETLIEEQTQYPFLKRIVAVSFENGGNLNQIREYLEEEIVSGVKVYLGYTVDDANSKLLKQYYDIAAEFDTPVLFHLGKCYKYKGTVSPLDILPVLEKYPEQKFILCHFGYPLVEDLKNIVINFDNAFTDLSGLMTYEDVCGDELEIRSAKTKYVLEELLDNSKTRKKVMYGSDYPLISLKQYHDIVKAIVPDKFYNQIFYKNAKDFFRL